MRDIRVATVQFQHAPGDKAYNLGRVRHFAVQADRTGVEILTSPRCASPATGTCASSRARRSRLLAEPVPADRAPRSSCSSRGSTAHHRRRSLERGPDGRIYNGYVVAMPDGRWAVHRKLHVFEHPNILRG